MKLKLTFITFLTASILCSCTGVKQTTRFKTDISKRWDTVTTLINPDKGWYHHYMDNSLTGYGIASEAEIDTFPGMHHLFIRIPWAALEPQQGKFDWQAIDTSVARWAAKGYKFSLDITCKETMGKQMPYATPAWVEKAGAKGRMVNSWGSDNWEPDYDDPIFLEKLDNFHRAMAERYDGQDWLLDVTTGSIGEWGEGHSSSNVKADVVIKHIDILLNNYKNTQIMIGDDYLRAGKSDEETKILREYVKKNKISYRDDSIFWEDLFGFEGTLQNRDFFEDVWRVSPTTLELCHYRYYKDKYWNVPNGHGGGLDTVKKAIQLSHATFVSFHGTVREWHKDNPKAAVELINMMGYWFMPESMEASITHERLNISIAWINRGVAPAYNPYKLQIALTDSKDVTIPLTPVEAGNAKWLPGISEETYSFNTQELQPGKYKVEVMLYKELKNGFKRPVLLAIDSKYKNPNGSYNLGVIEL